MTARRTISLLLVLAAVLAAAGCEPRRARQPAWVNPLDVAEAALPKDPKDNNYILQRMEFGRLALVLGCPARALPRLREAFDQLGAERDNTMAALTTEQLKYYKGETYERAMLAVYLGILAYEAGDYNTARIFLSRALSADRAAVVKDTTPPSYGEDFGLAYYWIGKTYARLGDSDNCAIALRKAGQRVARKEKDVARELAADRKAAADREKSRIEGERWAYQTFSNPAKPQLVIRDIVNVADLYRPATEAAASLPGASTTNPVVRSASGPDEFFTPAFQAEANLVCTIEVGRCPFKYLGGVSGERTEFGRTPVRPRSIRVYIDGHFAGEAHEVLDLWDQAATQDRIAEKDAVQTGKALTKEVLKHLPYVGSVAGYWNVQGDVRHWTSLPGKVFVYAGKISPGVHSVRLEMFDCTGRLLPRWTSTYWGICVPADGEACFVLNPRYDGDNRLSPQDVQKAMAAGARPGPAYDY